MIIRLFLTIALSGWIHLVFAADKLIFAIDVIRHGDRTPLKELQVDPHNWPEGFGELTPKGMQQLYELGKLKREEYIDRYHLLPERYLPSTLLVRSTDYNRTLMSAQSFLLGLYPLQSAPTLPDGQFALPDGFQPIPIHSAPLDKDSLLAPLNIHHKAFLMIKNSIKTNSRWREKLSQHQANFLHWSELLHEKINIASLEFVHDTLYIRELQQIPLPKGLTTDDAKAIAELSHWSMLEFFKMPAVYRLMSKELLAAIDSYLHSANHDPNALKYVLYSAHDVTILALLTALGQDVNQIPPYASNLSFLLFETEDRAKYVRIVYNQQALVLTGCEINCPLPQFERQIQQRLGIKPI